MRVEKLDRLVARLEKECAASPQAYRLKVILLASVSYLYVVLISALAVGGVVWSVLQLMQGEIADAIQVGLLSGLLALFLVPALWVKIPRPQGKVLQESDAPRLFAMIDTVRRKSGGGRIDEVILNDVFNTAIVQIPRLGILGWHRNVLVIGLPVLQTLSRKEFAAILAHEFGHLTRRHGKLSTWIYRIRAIWSEIHESFGGARSFGWLLITWPLRRYIPYFSAYSFVLARRDEYEADRLAAAIIGPRTLADALVAIAVRRRFVEERFWPDLWGRAGKQPGPPYLPHGSMRTALHLGLTQACAEQWLREELQRNTAFDDTHPCLRDRIRALDTPCELPPEAALSAAQSLLGEKLPALQRYFDDLWLGFNAPRWREQYHKVSSAHETVARWQSRTPDSLGPAELCHLAMALETLGRNNDALPLLRRAADHPHGPATAALAVARILHGRNDEATIDYLELAMQRDQALLEEAVLQAAAFYEARGDVTRAGNYWHRLEALA
jgi:Zn-dependent protease with chaperone function